VLIRLAIAALLVIAGTACKHNKHANTTVRHRAMFDFSCSEAELNLTVIDTEGARNMASQIAVYGCGQKAVYAYYPDSDTWLLDGAVTPMPADYQVPPHVTKGKGKKREDKRAAKAEKHGKMGAAEAPQSLPEAQIEPAAPVESPPAVDAETPVPDPS
jgi:hypothetical protein